MPVPISITRPKLAATNVVNESIDFGTAAIPVDDATAIELPVYLSNLDIDDIVVSAGPTWSTASADVVGAPGDFSNAKPGDFLSTPIDISTPIEVSSVSGDGSTITLASNPPADTNSGSEVVTVDPGAIDATVYILRLKHAVSGTSLVVTPTIYCLDGSAVEEGLGSQDDYDNATIGDATVVKTLPTATVNLDSFLTAARVARTN